jgi:hypothetical protein
MSDDTMDPAGMGTDGGASPAAGPGKGRRVRRFQACAGTGVLLLFLALWGAADLLARSDAVNRWLSQRQMAKAARNDELYLDAGAYFDAADALLLRDLPRADYSKGGVYLLGSSQVKYCLDDYRLPPEQARLIHNYGINGSNLTQMYHFARFMDEDQHFLSAGGERSMVMLGLTYTNVVERDRGHAHFFPEYFSRYGLYEYDDAAGVTPVPMSGPSRFARTEWGRARSFILRCWRGSAQVQRVPQDKDAFRKREVERVGTEREWRPAMRRQLADLEKLLDYLKARRVEVVGFMVPEGSWNARVPSREAFDPAVREMFRQRGLTLLDYSDAVPDENFADYGHLMPSGTAIVRAKLLPVAQDFLRKTGALNAR